MEHLSMHALDLLVLTFVMDLRKVVYPTVSASGMVALTIVRLLELAPNLLTSSVSSTILPLFVELISLITSLWNSWGTPNTQSTLPPFYKHPLITPGVEISTSMTGSSSCGDELSINSCMSSPEHICTTTSLVLFALYLPPSTVTLQFISG